MQVLFYMYIDIVSVNVDSVGFFLIIFFCLFVVFGVLFGILLCVFVVCLVYGL